MRSYFIVGKIFSFVSLKNESGFLDEGRLRERGESVFPKFWGVLLIKVGGGGAHIGHIYQRGFLQGLLLFT